MIFKFTPPLLVLLLSLNVCTCFAQGGLGSGAPRQTAKPAVDLVTTPERLNSMRQTSSKIKADFVQLHGLLEKQKQILNNMGTLLKNGETRKYCIAQESSGRKIADLKNRATTLSKDEMESLKSYVRINEEFRREIIKLDIKCN